MITSLLRVVAALFALTFIVAACASDSGAQWTFAPVAVAEADTSESAGEASAESTTSEGESVTQEEVGEVDPPEAAEAEQLTEATEAEVDEGEEPATAAGDGRVVQIQADGALRFLDANGEQVQDIAVTPGETITFEVNNTAGFAHNFYIGEDSELMTPAGSTDTGIPDWSTGVQTLDWVVPDDIANLKFGCTVPGHYTLMQGTFSISDSAPAEAETPAEPEVTEAEGAEAEGAEAEGAEAGQSAQPATAAGGEPRVIPLEMTAALQIFQDGQQISDIPVMPGETVIFEIDNTAGFDHNFYIGQDAELSVAAATTDTGIPDWSTGVQTLEWVVPDDVTGLKFGCTVPGHYMLMQGTFSAGEAPTEATESAQPATAAGEGRIVQIQADGALQFLDAEGQKIQDIAVTPGETITFQVDNTAGFDHNFYIGEDSELMVPAGTTDTGIVTWATGVEELEWVVPDDIANLKFGCTVPGHYTLMQGTFSISE